jgi:hypothetical protein
VEQLVDRVKKGKYKSKDEIIASSQCSQSLCPAEVELIDELVKAAAAHDDDDIVAGPQKMTLKDSVCPCPTPNTVRG